MNVSIIILGGAALGGGGAQKRFFGLWINLRRRGVNCRLISYESTIKALLMTDEYSDVDNYADSIYVLPDMNSVYLKSVNTIEEFLTSIGVTQDEVLHFVMGYPLFHSLSNKIVFSDPYSKLDHLNIKSKVVWLLSFIQSDIIDILDPLRKQFWSKVFWYNPKKVSLTSNTFVDIFKYNSLPVAEKKNWLVYLGRFAEVKQIEEFVRTIPNINQGLKEVGVLDAVFFILGFGNLENKIREIIQGSEYKDINIRMYYEEEPYKILAQAKVFFSLQKYNNYPSKSLAEALSCQCIPIVTDNGTTRMIAKPEFSYYVPEKFSKTELKNKVKEVFSLSDEQLQVKTTAARNFVRDELSLDKMTDYYIGLYKQLDH